MAPVGVMSQDVKDWENQHVYVMDLNKEVLHIWQGYTRRGQPSHYTKCRDRRCGTPVMQNTHFMWAAFDPSHYPQCERCFAEDVV